MGFSKRIQERVSTSADAWAREHGYDGAVTALSKAPDALIAHVVKESGATDAVVRELLMRAAQDALSAAEKSLENLRRGHEEPAASTHVPLDGGGALRPMGLHLQEKSDPRRAAPVEELQRIDLGFRIEDIPRTRIALTDDATPKAIAQVVLEGRKLIKLVDEYMNTSADGGDTRQVLDDIKRIYQGLTSKAATNKGIFLTKPDAQVEVASPSALPSTPAASPTRSTRSTSSTSSKPIALAYAVAVDPATGEKVVLRPQGRVLEDAPLAEFVKRHEERHARGKQVHLLGAKEISALRSLDDRELGKAKLNDPAGPIEYITLLGAGEGDKTFTYPTRWVKSGGELFSRRMIVEGPYRGIFLDDLVTHLDEMARDEKLVDSHLKWLKPSQSGIAPLVSTMEVKEHGDKKTKLRLRVPSTPEWTAVRQSLALLANRLEGVKLIDGSKNTLFVFDASNLSFVQKVMKSFGKTPEAQALIDEHVGELLKFEKALTDEVVAEYSLAKIGGFKDKVVGHDGRVKRLELSTHQQRAIAQTALDGDRGAITLGPGMGKTLVAIAALQRLVNRGEKRPFLIVVPPTLEGGFHAEIYKMMESTAAKKLADRLVVMSYKEFRAAQRDGAIKAKDYGAVVYDEAHYVTDRRTAVGKSVLAFAHPHTFELTGTPQPQPEAMQTMDAAVRGVDLNAPEAKAERKQMRKWRNLLFHTVNGVAVSVKGPFELKRGLKIDPTREVLEWIRTHMIYADNADDDVELPKRTEISIPITMSKQMEEEYRKLAKPARIALEGLVSIFRDRGVTVRDDGAPVLYKDSRGIERTRLTRQARDPRVHDIKTALKPTINELNALTNTPERVKIVGKKLLEIMHDDEVKKIPKSRSLLFTDDKEFVVESARTLSTQIPTKLHAACTGDEIRLFRNGEEVFELGPFKAPFTEGAYRWDMSKPADPDTNPEYPAGAWRTFVLQLLGKHDEVATTTLFGPDYQAGQNLQWANVVVHLDRDTWSYFNMAQRERRALRRGQTRPVTVIHNDYVFAKPNSNLDRTIDQVRELQAKNDQRLLQGTYVAAQKIRLGEGFDAPREADAFDAHRDPDVDDLRLFAAGADPSVESVALAEEP